MMEEKVVFENDSVKVTNARFVVDGQTYAMNGVTSVRRFEKSPARALPIIVGLIGLASTGGSVIVGLLILAAAAGIWVSQKTEFSVLLSSSSGEARALSSKDASYIDQVVEALNTAIIQRG